MKIFKRYFFCSCASGFKSVVKFARAGTESASGCKVFTAARAGGSAFDTQRDNSTLKTTGTGAASFENDESKII